MKTNFLCSIFSFLLITSISINSSGQKNHEVRKISIEGAHAIPTETLLNAMTLHSTSFWEKTFSKKEASIYHSQLIEPEIDRLKRFYQREGFLDVEINVTTTAINNSKEKLDLTFKIQEGAPFLIDSVLINTTTEGMKAMSDSVFKSIYKSFLLKPSTRFRDDALASDLNLLKTAFRNIGYEYAQTDYRLKIDTASRQVQIDYHLEIGPKCYFGETTLEGNKHIAEKFLLKQLTYKKGDVYSPAKLDDTRKSMYKLQLFSVLSLQPQTRNEKKTSIPVRLYIDEAPRFTSKYGLGYGTEDKFRAFMELNYKGLWGGASRTKLEVKHSELTPYQFSLSWIQPHFLNQNLSVAVNPFIGRFNEPGYDIRDLGFNVKFSTQRSDNFALNLNYYFENVKNFEASQDSASYQQADVPYSKSGILFSVLFDNSQPRFSPNRGFNILLAYKLNGYLFGGDYSYSRIWTDLRQYQKLGKLVFASRLMIGGNLSDDQDKFIPVEDRFYAGGSNSVRGWQRSELGPLRDNDTPLGGNSVLQGSAELRIPLFRQLSMVSFFDFGNVWVDEFKYQLNELAYAGGGGIRFDTPIGPIRFDVGVPLWNEKRSAQFFISVGQAF
ncbi:outer membrane protein assembly factor [Mangrovibacterium sp.]|uniref:BamA/OMP85 family outer membrane protein n=1 Tax=Mangrovibacterium sp. TaxID=1961364 RepID=UPI003563FFCB